MAETRILEGRRAIVTGASRGIRAEIARAMARAGAAVVLAARDEEALDRVAAEIEREGGRAVVAPADVSKLDAVERLVASSVNALGGLDIDVASAAVWLCSGQASFVTGATLVIDGGKLAGMPPFSAPGS